MEKKPFLISRRNKIVAAVVDPDELDLYKCRICGYITREVVRWQSRKYGKWRKIAICKDCQDKYL